MRRFLIPLVCFFSLGLAQPASAGWRDYVSPTKNWHRVRDGVSGCYNRVSGYCVQKVARARADQEKTWGLKLPPKLDENRRLVVLVHGLDTFPGMWWSMATLLEGQGYQVAYFNYPDDASIDVGAKRLERAMTEFRAAHPGVRVDFVGHSMGALVARAYIEGDAYTYGVDRFIAIAPPNHGSCWVRGRWALEWNEHYWLCKTNPDWSPLWMLTDGLGQATDDLKPGSSFLTKLNDRPRREGVRYTIVAGTHNASVRLSADAVARVEGALPEKNWWGVRHTRAGLARAAERLRQQTGRSDGVVETDSARLEGVTDVVYLPGDHTGLAMGIRGNPPLAWDTVRDRLAR
jgi:pimeloyl-ACP methyl ester carboxylesterase